MSSGKPPIIMTRERLERAVAKIRAVATGMTEAEAGFHVALALAIESCAELVESAPCEHTQTALLAIVTFLLETGQQLSADEFDKILTKIDDRVARHKWN